MKYIGEYIELEINRFTSVGAFLTDNNDFEVLLPNKYLTDEMEVNQTIKVFVYNDSEDRPVATTETPKIDLNEFAFLRVKSVNNIGAFLDWGLEKDLLVPFKEQLAKMNEGGVYLIKLLLDKETNRLIGSAKVNRYLNKDTSALSIGEKVNLFICEKTDLGRKVIINGEFSGLLYHNRIIKNIKEGDQIDGYIEFIRTDGKIDVSLTPIGIEKFEQSTEEVLKYIQKNNGTIYITDKSDSQLIQDEIGMSKKLFKKAVGNLYKARKIIIKANSIELTK